MTIHKAEPDHFLRTAEAARLLGVSAGTLQNWRSVFGHDRLPYILLNGRDVRYRLSAVERFIAEREAATPDAIRRKALYGAARSRVGR